MSSSQVQVHGQGLGKGEGKVIYDGPVDNNVTLVDDTLFFSPV